MENWALEPEVLKGYAKHWKTNEPIPAALVAKIHEVGALRPGLRHRGVRGRGLPRHELAHADRTEARGRDGLREGVAREDRAHSRDRLPLPEPLLPAHLRTGGGYSAGYYSYLWSEVLDADAFEAFREKGIFDKATATSFRKNILEKGGTAEAMSLYKAFRGREPSVQPLLVRRGLAPAVTPVPAATN